MNNFNDLQLSEPVLRAIAEMGFENPTEIQQAAIPILLGEPQDFIGLAQTGTGKTAAFGLPLIERIDASIPHTQALILAPTRELGQQIAEQLKLYSKYAKRLFTLPVYGGAPIAQQIKALRRPQHILIATPGRLIDLINRKSAHLDHLKYLVLDEADEMLNMGFQEELEEILYHTPAEKNVWLFSATMPNEIQEMVGKYMHDPKEVKVDSRNSVNQNIDHYYTIVTRANKTEALMRFIEMSPDMHAVVFCRTRMDTQELADELKSRNLRAEAIHGDMSQPQRDRVMRKFKNHQIQLLIATDVAARGIDVKDLTHVFHYKLPDDTHYYTHRSGRTARAGKSGISIAFINGREKNKIRHFQDKLNIEFRHIPIPNAHSISKQRLDQWYEGVLEQRISQEESDLRQIQFAIKKFKKLSKDELIAKMVSRELEGIELTGKDNLNESESKQAEKHRRNQSRKQYGRRDFKKRGKKKFKGRRSKKR